MLRVATLSLVEQLLLIHSYCFNVHMIWYLTKRAFGDNHGHPLCLNSSRTTLDNPIDMVDHNVCIEHTLVVIMGINAAHVKLNSKPFFILVFRFP